MPILGALRQELIEEIEKDILRLYLTMLMKEILKIKIQEEIK